MAAALTLGLAALTGCPTDSGAAIAFQSVSANGNAGETTTRLTLTFSAAIPGLSSDDILLGGVPVNRGALSGSGPVYTLPISGLTQSGELTVAVSNLGCGTSPFTQTVNTFTAADIVNGGARTVYAHWFNVARSWNYDSATGGMTAGYGYSGSAAAWTPPC